MAAHISAPRIEAGISGVFPSLHGKRATRIHSGKENKSPFAAHLIRISNRGVANARKEENVVAFFVANLLTASFSCTQCNGDHLGRPSNTRGGSCPDER